MVEITADKGNFHRSARAPLKFYALMGLATIFAFASGYLLSTGSFLYGSAALMFFLTLFIVESLFVSERFYALIAAALNALAFSAPFLKFFSIYFLFGFGFLLLLLLDGSNRGRRELDNMIKIRFARIVRVVSRSMISGIVIFLSVMLILSANFSITKESTEKALGIASPIIKRFVEGFNARANTGELLANITEKELLSSDIFLSLSPQERNAVIQNQTEELQASIEESIGTTIDLDISVAENVYEIVDNRLSSLTPKTRAYWSLILVAAVWLSIQGVEFIIFAPLAVLVFLIYELLFALKFARIENITKSKEIISLQ